MAERSLTFGPFRLDVFQNRLWRQAQPIALRSQAFAILRYLVLHSDQLPAFRAKNRGNHRG